MKNRRGLRHHPSDKAPVSFYDVVDSFSEEEWKLLQLWQKELYNNLMKELQQAFNALGPFIATSVFSLKPKVKENTCYMKLQDLDTVGNVNLFSGDIASESDMMFEESQYLKSSPDACEHGSLDVSNEGTADMAAAVSFSIKSEEEVYSNFENSETNSCTTRLEVTAPVASIDTNEVGEIYAIDMQDDPRGESSNSPLGSNVRSHIRQRLSDKVSKVVRGSSVRSNMRQRLLHKASREVCAGKGNMNRKGMISSNDQLRIYKTASKKVKPNIVRSVEQNKPVIQMWPANEHELEMEKKTTSQSGFHRQADFSFEKTAPCVQPLEVYDNSESLVEGENNVPCEKNLLKAFGPQTSSEIDQNYWKDCSNGQKQERKSKVQYHCTECGKTCLWMSSLLIHQRIHTGERPFLCTICGKRFTQNWVLHRHQQVHTGARPYKCNLCQKTFTQKGNLHKHEKSHSKTEMF